MISICATYAFCIALLVKASNPLSDTSNVDKVHIHRSTDVVAASSAGVDSFVVPIYSSSTTVAIVANSIVQNNTTVPIQLYCVSSRFRRPLPLVYYISSFCEPPSPLSPNPRMLMTTLTFAAPHPARLLQHLLLPPPPPRPAIPSP